jgi:hypothetical protein
MRWKRKTKLLLLFQKEIGLCPNFLREKVGEISRGA